MSGGEPTKAEAAVRTSVVARPTLELVCRACGYGVVVRRIPPICPMCRHRAWVSAVWRPFSRRPEPPQAA
jgi:rubrerythrin